MPQDSLLLPNINRMIDATTSNEIISFLEAYPNKTKYKRTQKTRKKLRSSLSMVPTIIM